MTDSARARTVGSSSTTRTFVDSAFFGVIRFTRWPKHGNLGAKSEVPTLTVILQLRLHLWHFCSGNLDPGTSDQPLWTFALIRGVSCDMHRASAYGEQT